MAPGIRPAPSRRAVVGASLATALGAWIAGRDARAADAPPAPKSPTSPNEKLNIGVVGVSNRGASNLGGVHNENIVALCDVDDRYLAQAAKNYPRAETFNDFRKMLDKVKGLDAVVVSTADHCHCHASVAALRLGKHVYCEKPLTHSVWEARLVAREAAKAKKATQMGTQIHAGENYRRVVEIVQSGAIGAVKRVHVFVTSGYGLKPSSDKAAEPPPQFHWDLWLGPAPEQKYNPDLHPQRWRRYWDFGGGTLGDFGCHHLDLSFWALGLRAPTAVQATGPAPDPVAPPAELTVDFFFPAAANRGPVQITWAHGAKRPPAWDELGVPKPKWGNGTVFVGDKGVLAADYGKYLLLPADKFASFQPPPKSIPRSIGHHEEWIKACKEGTPTTCNFDYGGALTETVLLGNVSHRIGNKRLEWDAEKLAVTNAPDAAQFLRRAYRKGWELEG